MEQLTKTELLLIKSCILSEKSLLESKNYNLSANKMSSTDLADYASNQELINRYTDIIKKLS